MAHAFPADAPRIARALTVLATRQVVATGTAGRYLVEATDTWHVGVPTFYEATSLQCSCPDARQHPDQRCKHSWALDLLATASAIAAREAATAASQDRDILDLDPDAPIPFELTPLALHALDAAACAVCGHDAESHYRSSRGNARCDRCFDQWCQPPAAVADQPFRPNYHHSHTCPACGYHAYHPADADCAALDPREHFGGCPDLGLCATCGHPVNEHDTQDGVRRCGGCPDWRCQAPAADPDVSQVTSDATPPQNGSQSKCGPIASGPAACPHCGRIRHATFDGDAIRCMGCWHRWIPTAATAVSA
jgi:hypothetical protein